MEELAMTIAALPSARFWRGKRVALTGHTGFKGAWTALWLRRLGAEVVGISLPPHTAPNLFELVGGEGLCDSRFQDIRDAGSLGSALRTFGPQVVLHLAAQALVRTSYGDPLDTFATNVQGTANLLEAVRTLDCARVVVAVTTDKVYRQGAKRMSYREGDELGGHDPYSASKAAAEMVIASYRDSFLAARGVGVASARAGNVIGGGDWSADRLLPDAVRAWQRGDALEIRHPQAIRPWQHVLEPLAGYLILAERLWESPGLAQAYNFGPQEASAATVKHVAEMAREAYGSGAISYQNDSRQPHEAEWLALDASKARNVLGVKPRWTLNEAVRRTMQWYLLQREGASARSLCEADFSAYEALT